MHLGSIRDLLWEEEEMMEAAGLLIKIIVDLSKLILIAIGVFKLWRDINNPIGWLMVLFGISQP